MSRIYSGCYEDQYVCAEVISQNNAALILMLKSLDFDW